MNIDGVRLHSKAAGSRNAPLLILLHGFPEFWYGWRHQIDSLSRHFYVVAPDQRGYNLSEKPGSIEAYRLNTLARDVDALATALGFNDFYLAGHDWGGLVAWRVTQLWPARVQRLAILNAPHPGVIRDFLRRSLRQMLRSWYAAVLQLPFFPEILLTFRQHAVLRNALASSSAGVFSGEELERYVEAWSQPGALRAMINYYRAAARYPDTDPDTRIHVPTLVLWGDRDQALEPELAELSSQRCDRAEVVHVPEATHWIQHERPQQVNDNLLRFFSS